MRGRLMREGEFRDPSGCAVAGVIDRSGRKMTGEGMIEAIADSTLIMQGGYRVLTRDEVVKILKESL